MGVGGRVACEYSGTVRFKINVLGIMKFFSIHKVIYAPQNHFNLISTKRICEGTGYGQYFN